MRPVLQSVTAWQVTGDTRTKPWHGAASVATAGCLFFPPVTLLSENSVKAWTLSHRKKKTNIFYTKLPAVAKNCRSFWLAYPRAAAVFLQKAAVVYKNTPSPSRKSEQSWHPQGPRSHFGAHVRQPGEQRSSYLLQAYSRLTPGSPAAALHTANPGWQDAQRKAECLGRLLMQLFTPFCTTLSTLKLSSRGDRFYLQMGNFALQI